MLAAQAPRLASRPIERRRHRRVPVVLLGRYMLPNRQEYPCQTLDISPGGLSLIAPIKATVGDRVVVYTEHLGRVEGVVARTTDEGFAMTISATPRKRDKMASQLTWLANRDLGLPEDRRHDRVTPRNARSVLRLESGVEHAVRLLDISLSGAAFNAEVSLPMGTAIYLGQTLCKVVRKFETGYAVEFRNPITPERLNENIDL
jgi:hypothetical protein